MGLLLTDRHLRLVYAPRGETSGWLAFPLRALGVVGGRPMLGELKLLLSAFRLHNDAVERRLPGLLKASREAQAEVSSRLAVQVLGALHELLRGLHAADRERIERLATQRSAHLYEGLLTVLLRLVFLLYAEDRALIPSRADGQARALYEEGLAYEPCTPDCSAMQRATPTRWTNGAARGVGCSRCSGWSMPGVAQDGSAAEVASCLIPPSSPSCRVRIEPEIPKSGADYGWLHPAHS